MPLPCTSIGGLLQLPRFQCMPEQLFGFLWRNAGRSWINPTSFHSVRGSIWAPVGARKRLDADKIILTYSQRASECGWYTVRMLHDRTAYNICYEGFRAAFHYHKLTRILHARLYCKDVLVRVSIDSLAKECSGCCGHRFLSNEGVFCGRWADFRGHRVLNNLCLRHTVQHEPVS